MAEDIIARSLDMTPLAIVEGEVVDALTGEVLNYAPSTDVALVEDVDPVDEAMQEAEEDFHEIRDNIHELMREGMSLFRTARDLAVNSQDPDHMGGAARIFAETLKANKELMNVHKDRFTLRPPVQQNVQKAETINNIVFKGTQREFLQQLKLLQQDDETSGPESELPTTE